MPTFGVTRGAHVPAQCIRGSNRGRGIAGHANHTTIASLLLTRSLFHVIAKISLPVNEGQTTCTRSTRSIAQNGVSAVAAICAIDTVTAAASNLSSFDIKKRGDNR